MPNLNATDAVLYMMFLGISYIAVSRLYTLLALFRKIKLAEHGRIAVLEVTAAYAQGQQAKFGMQLLYVAAQLSPFIGLTGTVLRIQEALTTLSATSSITEIAHPVGAALHSTFLGLVCAILAVAAYGWSKAGFGWIDTKLESIQFAIDAGEEQGENREEQGR